VIQLKHLKLIRRPIGGGVQVLGMDLVVPVSRYVKLTARSIFRSDTNE
jgi:hypothetical protein